MLIAQCEEKDGVFILNNPVFIAYVPGQGSMLVDVLEDISDDTKIEVLREHILFSVKPSSQIEEVYRNKLSPVVTTTKQLIY